MLISFGSLRKHTCDTAQTIIQPPVSTTAALGTNATFSCRGAGSVLWQINGTQVLDAGQVPVFERVQVYVPLRRANSSELIVTATRQTNATLEIICAVDQGIVMGDLVRSDAVHLLVYGTCVCSIVMLISMHIVMHDLIVYLYNNDHVVRTHCHPFLL